ncbi:hypothetical protein [Nonomuraea recticatena]|uniref:Uncharacterized protein n=1 Tax=Nonomuraea recticatena TaxID=46178 RepID=A0ABN3S0L8_9ACTN
MAGESFPFDGGPGSAITETQWSQLVRDSTGNGVHAAGPWTSDLRVSTLVENNTVWLSPGRATLNGFHYNLGAQSSIFVEGNTALQDRIDALVLRLDLSANEIQPVVRTGQPASSPVPPAVDSSTELLLATWRVRGSTSRVETGDLFDGRSFIGRRLLVSEALSAVQGDITYRPSDQTWHGTAASSTKQLADTALIASAVSAHTSATDPHTQYLTEARGNNRYAPVSHTHPAQVSYAQLTASTGFTANGAYVIKTNMGMCTLTGMMNVTATLTNGKNMSVIPASVRPPYQVPLSFMINTAPEVVIRAWLYTDGRINLDGYSSSTSISTGVIHLMGTWPTLA